MTRVENIAYNLLSIVHALSWSIYAGGAICMELILRHAQEYMKPSQIAVVCENSGKRYRWWSLFCLLGLVVSGIPLVALGTHELGVDRKYSVLLACLTLLWLVQVLLLAVLSFRFHPEMHARLSSSMSAEEIKRERQRVGAAIVNMNITVRIELGCIVLALALGAALHLV
ncbi:MAG: hypothetical protein CMQ19_12690 [Gammaproteobacteria bacterium]|jgi:uncharacterized membrane protein|nr:hypothetical protein [Gammaproteobacteria bacterium]|tara:strand:+ start:7226 stop:7735 length:510 start_codon:yes stop_codon:yes gene_type:complete